MKPEPTQAKIIAFPTRLAEAIRPVLALTVLILLLAGCGKQARVPVPADAFVVFHIDGNSLASKMSWEEVQQSEWYKIAREEASDSMARILINDPEASGIETKGDTYIFMKMQGKGGYMAVVGNVKDEKNFTSFMEKTMEGKKAEMKGELSFISSDNSVLTWKGTRFVLVMDSPELNSASQMGAGSMDSYERYSFPPDSLLMFAESIYSIKGKQSLGNDSRFSNMLKEKGDMHFWMNSGSMFDANMPAALALTKINLLFKGNVASATLNFDNGKISIDGKNYYNKELGELYAKYKMKNMDEAMLKMIPPGDVAAVFAMNYPPEGLKAFASLLGIDGLINMFLAGDGFSLDDFIKANKGDILFSVSDFGIATDDEDSSSWPSHDNRRFLPSAKLLFATSVNDKPAFEKMISLLQKKLSTEGGASVEMMAGRIPYLLKDDWFIAGNDSSMVHGFGAASTQHSFLDKLKGHPMGGYIDIQKFINGAKPAMDSLGLQIADESLKTWQDIIFYGGEFRNNATTTHGEINMADKNTNSLKQLSNYMGFIARIINEQEKKRKMEAKNMFEMTDTVAAPVPLP